MTGKIKFHIIRFDPLESSRSVINFLYNNELKFYSEKTINRILHGGDNGRKPYIVYLAKNRCGSIVGISITSVGSKTMSLLFVKPSCRGNGIGRELYRISKPQQILLKRDALAFFSKVDAEIENEDKGGAA